ncbi:MAG: glycosyltransferase family 4 protein [Chitinispirillaceae bacterium]|jgi:glycosyltransferase involved in cell wall biosynthesis
MTKKVLIVQRYIAHYQISFFEQLCNALESASIQLELIGGQGSLSDRAKRDAANIPWVIPSNDFYLFGERLVFQPCLRCALSADLVIIEQANKYLLNYVLQFLRPFSHRLLAFWGHGFCHQQSLNSPSNKFKSFVTKHVDWWFAYTESVAEYVEAQGFPKDRITVVQNAIDTSSLSQMAAQVTSEDIALLRKKYGLTQGKTGVFCGGMYKEKQLPFLIQCAEELHKQDQGFSMIFIGSGVDAHLVEEAASRNSWIHYAGPEFGLEKVKLILAADFMLSPGLVGLGILDSFVLERPLVTTDYPLHSPEITYLDNNVNGILTPFTMEAYSKAVTNLMWESARLQKLRCKCRESGQRYTIETMVEKCVKGIQQCLLIGEKR